MLKKVQIDPIITRSGAQYHLPLTYEVFGRAVHTAPIILVNHALTGNSNVAGEHGWWTELIGKGKCINTDHYTVLAFNIPGNGYDGTYIDNYQDFVAQDTARIFLNGLKTLGISQVFAIMGGSLGGGIAWEMAALNPGITEHLVPIAADWQSTDWLIANCRVQEQILNNSKDPVHDARLHAMLCYRTPASFRDRFERTVNEDLGIFNVESWLLHHGNKLRDRFSLEAYKLNNQLLKTIDIGRDGPEGFEAIKKSKINIHIIGVNSDLFFTIKENRETFNELANADCVVTYGEINSKFGHDSFLIEFEQLAELLYLLFKKPRKTAEKKINTIDHE